MLSRGDPRLVLSAPGGGPGGGQAMPDGRLPEPGGWNLIGVGGKQILLEDPSGIRLNCSSRSCPEASLSPREP
jgi:hypothetical protein